MDRDTVNRVKARAWLDRIPYRGPGDRPWITRSLTVYEILLRERIHFAQAAYRDAEFPWLMNRPDLIGNPNGEIWEPALGEALRETLLDYRGQWLVYFAPGNPVRPLADAWLAEHAPDLTWIPDRPFGRASEQGLLRPFFEAIRGRRTCLIGPHYLGPPSLPCELISLSVTAGAHLLGDRWDGSRWGSFWPLPEGTAWKEADRVAACIVDAADQFDLFLIAGGSMAALVIWRAWPEVRDRATLIDIGATLDPYAGVFSRTLHRDPTWRREILPQNLPKGVTLPGEDG